MSAYVIVESERPRQGRARDLDSSWKSRNEIRISPLAPIRGVRWLISVSN